MRHRPRTPKVRPGTQSGRAHWYPYYAGYSPGFVEDILGEFGVTSDTGLILDPWNGSGTTTTICSRSGLFSVGFDLNPVMVVVAKARLLGSNISPSLRPLLEQIVRVAPGMRAHIRKEPLSAWFDDGTASRIRAVINSTLDLLVDNGLQLMPVDQLSSLAAFFFVLIFRLVRRLAKRIAVSNPTWMKREVTTSEKIHASMRYIREELVRDLANIELLEVEDSLTRLAESTIKIADSRSLPLPASSVDVVISSPPYCTRIDYAAATRLELAILGYQEDDFRALRRNMLGTTLSSKAERGGPAESKLVSEILRAIQEHPSKASATYYFRTYQDYFSKLHGSIAELARVTRQRAQVALVVQESAYKNMKIDLAHVCIELMAECGFESTYRWDYANPRSMGRVKSSIANPVESVLTFRRKGCPHLRV